VAYTGTMVGRGLGPAERDHHGDGRAGAAQAGGRIRRCAGTTDKGVSDGYPSRPVVFTTVCPVDSGTPSVSGRRIAGWTSGKGKTSDGGYTSDPLVRSYQRTCESASSLSSPPLSHHRDDPVSCRGCRGRAPPSSRCRPRSPPCSEGEDRIHAGAGPGTAHGGERRRHDPAGTPDRCKRASGPRWCGAMSWRKGCAIFSRHPPWSFA